MKYEDLEKVNKELQTVDIKGKDYVEVNKRITAFRKLYAEGTIETDIQHLQDGVVVIKATVKDTEGKTLATGLAYEKENSTFINKTSYIENCETSAVGRALGMLGIGIDTSIASAEEVETAIINQEGANVINKTKIDALNQSITNNKISDEQVEKVLSKYGYSSTSEIKMKDYMNIVQELSKLKVN